MDTTIFAISSGHGKAGVVVFRISGPKAFNVIDIFHISNLKIADSNQISSTELRSSKPLIENEITTVDFGRVYLRKLFYHTSNSNINNVSKNTLSDKILIDKAILLFFKAPKSFTGENCVEIHAHGSYAVMDMISKILANQFSPAMRGEFTKRALLNGKMSLYEVEGLNDLLSAKTWSQHQLAMTQFSGKPNQVHISWRNILYQILAYLEVYIDFPEEDIPENLIHLAKNLMSKLLKEFQAALVIFNQTQKIQQGIKIALIGKPNVGKSSLINIISNRNVSIVSKISGTTRDIVESVVELDGFQINFLDTAGINIETTDKIEQIGVNLALKNLEEADIVLIILDIVEIMAHIKANQINDALISSLLEIIFTKPILKRIISSPDNILFVLNKIDLVKHEDICFVNDILNNMLSLLDKTDCSITVKQLIDITLQKNKPIHSQYKILTLTTTLQEVNNLQKETLENLCNEIKVLCSKLEPSEYPLLFNLRHQYHIKEAICSVSKALNIKLTQSNLVFLIEEIRQASFALEIIIGRLDVEEILAKIFSEFCIGK